MSKTTRLDSNINKNDKDMNNQIDVYKNKLNKTNKNCNRIDCFF